MKAPQESPPLPPDTPTEILDFVKGLPKDNYLGLFIQRYTKLKNDGQLKGNVRSNIKATIEVLHAEHMDDDMYRNAVEAITTRELAD